LLLLLLLLWKEALQHFLLLDWWQLVPLESAILPRLVFVSTLPKVFDERQRQVVAMLGAAVVILQPTTEAAGSWLADDVGRPKRFIRLLGPTHAIDR
jgi:hypothetical protein